MTALSRKHFEGCHPSLEDARKFANSQVAQGADPLRVLSAFACITGALVAKHFEGCVDVTEADKQGFIQTVVTLVRTAADGPNCQLPASLELQ